MSCIGIFRWLPPSVKLSQSSYLERLRRNYHMEHLQEITRSQLLLYAAVGPHILEPHWDSALAPNLRGCEI